MKFNLFDKKPEDPRVAAVREMAKDFRDMANSLETDIKENAKAGRHEICDECGAELVVKVLDGSSAITALFSARAKIPGHLVQGMMVRDFLQKTSRGAHSTGFEMPTPPRSMMS